MPSLGSKKQGCQFELIGSVEIHHSLFYPFQDLYLTEDFCFIKRINKYSVLCAAAKGDMRHGQVNIISPLVRLCTRLNKGNPSE